MGLGSAWDVSIDQINQIVWVVGSKPETSKAWVAKSRDKGDTWETTFLTLDRADSIGYNIAIHPNNPDIIYIATNESVIKTGDSGQTWQYTGLREKMTHLYALAIDPFYPNHIWVGGAININYLALFASPFVLYESFTGGMTWQVVSPPAEWPENGISSIAADPNQQGVLYIASMGDGVWRYQCKEPSLASYFPLQVENWWTFSNSVTETIIDSVRFGDSLYFKFDQFRHFPNGLLRMTSDNKLLLRDNATEQIWLDFSAEIGEMWQVKAPDGMSEWTVHLQSKSDTVIVPAGTFTDCYRFWFQFAGADNDWMEWFAPGVGPVKRILYGFAVVEYPLTSAWVNGVWYPTKVADPPEDKVPEKFHLYPNYPNPFNTSTVIRYDLPQANIITLEIYNLLGQKVKTLVNSFQSSGQHQILWDGREDKGKQLSSNLYICRLQVGNVIKFQKLVLQK